MIVGTEDQEQADRLFGALANSTRRDIVTRTLRAEYSVSQLARCYTTSFAAVQKHVAVLETAGLVTKRAQGREQLVRGDVRTIETVHALLDQLESVWRERIDRFDQTLKESDQGESQNDRYQRPEGSQEADLDHYSGL
jgi:DNA-binding transcriptional ArsR family regulator